MYLTATSTPFILLSEKIDHLYNAFDWTIGGIGIVMAITLALLGIGQLLYTKRLTNQEIDNFKIEIREDVTRLMDEQALKLKAVVDDDIDSLRRETQQQRYAMEGDIARNYALKCEEKDLHGPAFTWWLTAAKHYNSIDESNLLSISVKGAKDALNKIKDGDSLSISHLWSEMTDSQLKLSNLKNKHPSETKLLDDLMQKKASLSEEKKVVAE